MGTIRPVRTLGKLARPERFELPTSWFVGRGSMERKSMIFSSSPRGKRLIFLQGTSL